MMCVIRSMSSNRRHSNCDLDLCTSIRIFFLFISRSVGTLMVYKNIVHTFDGDTNSWWLLVNYILVIVTELSKRIENKNIRIFWLHVCLLCLRLELRCRVNDDKNRQKRKNVLSKYTYLWVARARSLYHFSFDNFHRWHVLWHEIFYFDFGMSWWRSSSCIFEMFVHISNVCFFRFANLLLQSAFAHNFRMALEIQGAFVAKAGFRHIACHDECDTHISQILNDPK